MDKFDVIVIGQGPGGAAAACELARQGMKVLALAGQPKAKPCGGCLSRRWRYLFDYLGAPNWLWEYPVDKLILAAPGRSSVPWRTRLAGAYFVDRGKLDAWLMESAQKAGARIVHQKARQVRQSSRGVTVRTDERSFGADWVIGADGALSFSKRRLGFIQRCHIFTALVEERPLPPHLADELEGGALIELNGVPRGYGWLFARGEMLNLGIGSWNWKRRTTRNGFQKSYAAFLKRYGLGEPGLYRGAAIPCPVAWAQAPVKGRAVWVGDAAALADPFLGEGIGQAICTGLLAAMAVANGDLSLYIKSLRKSIFIEHLHAWLLARLVFFRPGISHRMVELRPGVLEVGFGLLRGQITHKNLWGFLFRKLLALNPSLDRTSGSNYIKIVN